MVSTAVAAVVREPELSRPHRVIGICRFQPFEYTRPEAGRRLRARRVAPYGTILGRRGTNPAVDREIVSPSGGGVHGAQATRRRCGHGHGHGRVQLVTG